MKWKEREEREEREERRERRELCFRLRDQFAHGHLGHVTTTAIAQWQEPVRLVVSGGEDWTIRLWETTVLEHAPSSNTGTATEFRERDFTKDEGNEDDENDEGSSGWGSSWSKVLRGHTGPITDIALDLCKVTSCSMDGTIKIWGTVGKNAGNCIRTLSHPFSGARKIPVRCMAVGTLRLVAGFDDGTVLLYHFHKKEKNKTSAKKKKKKRTTAWRKGANSPQANHHAKNTLKGSNRKYVSGSNRRSMRDVKARTSKNVDNFFFDLDDL